MPKENYTISAFHGGLNSSSDPRDIRNEDLSVASGVDVSRVGKVSIMNGEEPHFSTGVTAERPVAAFSEVQPGYGLFSYKTDALGTSSQSSNFIISEQIQYGSAGSNSLGRVIFVVNELVQGDTSIEYKLMFNNNSIESGTSGAVSVDGIYYIPISGSNTINRGTSSQDLANNLANSINTAVTTGYSTWTEFSATRIGNQVRVKADTQTSDGNGTLILYATTGDLDKVTYNTDNMVGGVTPQHQKTRFIFPSDSISVVTYFISLAGSDRYTLVGHANDKPFHIINRFAHANGTTTTASIAAHPVYSGTSGTLAASASQNALKLNGSSNDEGIDANSGYSASLELIDNTSLLKNHNFGNGSTFWESAQFGFSGDPGSPIATYADNDSDVGHLKQTDFTIKANTLYQLSFVISVATLDLTFKNYAANVTYVNEISYAAGTHTLWFYQDADRTGFYINAALSSAGAGAITEIKLQEVKRTLVVESSSNTNFLVECGIEQEEGYIGNRWLAVCDRNSNVHTFSNTGGNWNTPISLGTGTNAKGVFYFVDGALRVCDSNHEEVTESTAHNSTNTPQWYGYVDRYFYGTSSAGYTDGGTSSRAAHYINRFVSADVALNALIVDDVTKESVADAPAVNGTAPIILEFTTTPDLTVDDLTPTPSSAWQASQTHAATAQTSTDGSGTGMTCTISTDGSGNPTFVIVSGGSGYVVDEEITFTDPGSTSNTAVLIVATTTVSTWAVVTTDVTYEVAVTTLYDDSKQESALSIPPVLADKTVDIEHANKLKVEFGLWAATGTAYSTGVHLKNPRVSGFHIYMREEGKTDWFLQWEVDIEKGIRAYKTGEYAAWDAADYSTGGTARSGVATCTSANLLDPRQIETYEIMTSRDQSYDSVSLDTTGNCWRSALIANRRAWIAAPTMQDELGNTVTKGDTMVKSNVNQFDSFTLDNRVDVAIRDGEDIVAIAEFGDRILQFKQQTLYIINISQDFEFLEGTYKNRGIVNHNAQCRTDYGVAWINESGCYLYDGKRVNNLLEKNNIDIIDVSTWTDFVNKDSVIGFAPKEKQLIILNTPIVSANSTAPNNVFVYDLILGAWTRGYNKWTNQNKTNFITDWLDGLIVGHNPVGIIKQWGSSADEKVFELVTKDIDFGKPAVRKKFYKVYITYKCSSADTNVLVQYYTNGGSTAYDLTPVDNATLEGGIAKLDGSKSVWTTAILKPDTSSEANNIYSIRIRLYNSSPGVAVPNGFEINDISLIHRRKPIK